MELHCLQNYIWLFRFSKGNMMIVWFNEAAKGSQSAKEFVLSQEKV
jgi:hypothetical protein